MVEMIFKVRYDGGGDPVTVQDIESCLRQRMGNRGFEITDMKTGVRAGNLILNQRTCPDCGATILDPSMKRCFHCRVMLPDGDQRDNNGG